VPTARGRASSGSCTSDRRRADSGERGAVPLLCASRGLAICGLFRCTFAAPALRPCKYLIGRVRSRTASGLAAAADRQTHQVGDRCLYAANPRHLRIKPGTARFLLQTAPTEYRKRSAGRGSRPQRRVCTLYSRVTLRTLILLACTRPGRRGRVGLQFIDTLQCVASDYNTSFFYQSFW
jgi:hypothetical protein